MFQVMRTLRISKKLFKMIRLLFYDATVSMNTNNQTIKRLEFHRLVCQGFPIASYLVIIMVEALNAAVKHQMRIDNLKGIGFFNAIPKISSANMLKIHCLQ